VSRWKTLEGHVDEEGYRDILARFEYQARQAVVWRDAICKWIYRLSGIADENKRLPASAVRLPARCRPRTHQNPRTGERMPESGSREPEADYRPLTAFL
jgi:hypothetical protein